ncbi:universal stress protein [Halostagnicola bangensis]
MALDTILVALGQDDDHESLLDTALETAGPSDATVVLGVGHPEDDYEAVLDDFEGDATPDELAARSATIRSITDRLADAGIEYEIRGGVGDTGETFVSIADAVGADLLYIHGQARSPTGKALFGDTAQSVLLNAPCPVTFVRQ